MYRAVLVVYFFSQILPSFLPDGRTDRRDGMTRLISGEPSLVPALTRAGSVFSPGDGDKNKNDREKH